MSSEKPDQIQASVAAALSRLRGDLGPSGAAAPKIEEAPPGGHGAGERTRPANDVRGDPFFRSIQSPPPEMGMAAPGRAPIPMTPFPRMQAPQEPAAPELPSQGPSAAHSADEDTAAAESPSAIEIPEMPGRTFSPDPAATPEPLAATSEPSQQSPHVPAAAAAQAAAPQPPAPGGNSPLLRVMRGTTDPAQRDLLADLPPPPISEPLRTDTESSATRRRRRNRRLLAIAAIIIVGAIGAWLWTGGTPSTEVPVVTAETTPEKVKPADEGGLQVQNQDMQVLDPSTQTEGEFVMPEPEQPIAPPAPGETASAGQAPTVVDNGETSPAAAAEAPTVDAPPAPGVPLTETPLPALEEEGATAATEPAPAVSAPDPMPSAQETTQEPTGAAEAPATAEPAPVQSAAEPTQASTPAPTPAPAPEPAQAAQPEAPAAQETPTQEAAVAPTVGTGNTRVQLAAGKSEASVQQEWAALQKAHPQLLGDLKLTIERADKGAAGIFYRMQAGPVADKAAARQLCASLKQRGQDCIVVAK